MTEEMTRWGIGPKFAVLSVAYSLATFIVSRHFDPLFRITFIPYWILATIGVVLISVGVPLFMIAVVTVSRAFNAGKLVTAGVYGMCRHPLYAAWVVLIVPGIVLLANSWIGLTAPPLMYSLLRILVKKEEAYLEKTFGEEYIRYKKRVPPVLPIGWI